LGSKGDIDESKGDKAVAIFDFNKAIKLNPDDTISFKALHNLEHP
jgi:hypothetical protein